MEKEIYAMLTVVFCVLCTSLEYSNLSLKVKFEKRTCASGIKCLVSLPNINEYWVA